MDKDVAIFIDTNIAQTFIGKYVYFSKLRQNDYKKNFIESLFRGSGSYINCPNNFFDCLIADEAHRLNAKSGMFQNLGENQIK